MADGRAPRRGRGGGRSPPTAGLVARYVPASSGVPISGSCRRACSLRLARGLGKPDFRGGSVEGRPQTLPAFAQEVRLCRGISCPTRFRAERGVGHQARTRALRLECDPPEHFETICYLCEAGGERQIWGLPSTLRALVLCQTQHVAHRPSTIIWLHRARPLDDWTSTRSRCREIDRFALSCRSSFGPLVSDTGSQ